MQQLQAASVRGVVSYGKRENDGARDVTMPLIYNQLEMRASAFS